MECDASNLDVGVVLMQKGQSIAFKNQKLSSIEKNFSMYDKDMLAIMHALERFKNYLVCNPFIIWINHNSLKYFLSQTNLSEKQ